MAIVTTTTHSPKETLAFGEDFCLTQITHGSVVTVRGQLGAGKTHFVKGIARALGIEEAELTSPTYALANEYDCELRGEAFRLIHLDCYRFERPEELRELGVEDYLYPEYGATVIEWPERIEHLLPQSIIDVRIEVISESEREFSIASTEG